MANLLRVTFSSLLFCLFSITCFSQKFGFDKCLQDAPDRPTTFCVPNNEVNEKALRKNGVTVKYGNQSWLFITTTPRWIDENTKNGTISDFYFEFAPPSLLGDSARAMHFVNDVHAGNGGLPMGYTGKGVVIGYVDTGADFNHPDFKNADGSTRILRYWDQGLATGPAPQPYGYGTIWDSSAINNLAITSMDNHSHGSTVAGQGSGNGLANGMNMGMAPESDIIIVESNFNANNWTLTVADACDYIFKVADTLGKPAIVNLSIGTYLGSHDGNDPASIQIENLLDEKPGRIVVAAAGNSGDELGYHAGHTVTSDTNFVWFKNNPTGAIGANTIFFDLWSDVGDATFDFGFGADQVSPTYSLRGMSDFHGAMSSVGTTIFDTIWNGGNRIATIQTYTSVVNGNFNMQVLFTSVDSTDYRYRFMTTGSGKYDLWSGEWLGYNDFETNIPTIAQMPDITHYIAPDSLQSIVSSWNCSEKVISVANMGNRVGHTTCDTNQFIANPVPVPGRLALSSSKGPNRHDVIKPDITATGEISIGCAPMWMVTNPGYCPFLGLGGYHLRNGGTSMAAPAISGIAALYLEKCSKATYSDFLTDLTGTATSDAFTGSVPNNAYGYGKAHALDLLLSTNFSATVTGPDGICEDSIDLTISSTATIDSAFWNIGSSNLPHTTIDTGDYHAYVYDTRGCSAQTDTHTVVQFVVPTIDPIAVNGDILSTTASHGYQWTVDGTDISGANNSTYTMTPPYGTYTCYTISPDGCIAETDSVVITVSLTELSGTGIDVYPNPVENEFQVHSLSTVKSLKLIGPDGRVIPLEETSTNHFSMNGIAKGIYSVIIETESGQFVTKISRL